MTKRGFFCIHKIGVLILRAMQEDGHLNKRVSYWKLSPVSRNIPTRTTAVLGGCPAEGIYEFRPKLASHLLPLLTSYHITNMPRSRSHSTSSLPGNLMASWSIHSYPASCVQNTIEDSPSEIEYPTTGQPTSPIHAQPTDEMMPPGIQASNASDFMLDPVFLPQHTILPMLGDTSVTQHIQIPSFADLQHSLTIPVMPPPPSMGHLPSAQMPLSGFISDKNPNLYHSMGTPKADITSIFAYGSGAYFGSHHDSQSKAQSHSDSRPLVRYVDRSPWSESCKGMFKYWVSTAAPRRFIILLFPFSSGL